MAADPDPCSGLTVPPVSKSSGTTLRAGILELIRSLFGSPQYERLAARINEAELRLYLARPKGDKDVAWAKAAECHLHRAKGYLAEWQLEMGWAALEDANDCMLHADVVKGTAADLAEEVYREAKAKLSGWRLEVVTHLLCDENGKLKQDIESARLIQARRVLTDQFETTRHRIALHRRHLQIVTAVLVPVLAVTVALSLLKKLPGDFNHTRLLVWIMVGGVLGACISVVQALMTAKLDQRIPDQLAGAFVIWVRPVLGCAAAVAAFGLLQANKAVKFVNLEQADDPAVMFAVALLAGYSERFILGAFGRLSDSLGGK